MSTFFIGAGVFSSGLVADAGDEINVLSGALLIDTLATNGGCVFVESGGKMLSGSAKDLGELWVNGTAYSTVVNSDGMFDVDSGGESISATVNNGGSMTVYSKGEATETTVNSGGNVVVAGGTATSTTVNGGSMRVSDGTATSATVNDGGTLRTEDAKVKDVTVDKGGAVYIGLDTVMENLVLNGGEAHVESDGWAFQTSKGIIVSSNTIVKNGGMLYISSGGHVEGLLASDGGQVNVDSDGILQVAEFASATLDALNGASISSATLLDGGRMNVFTGGSAQNVTVSEGGILAVESGGQLGGIYVSAGGVLTGVVKDGATIRMYGGTLDFDISGFTPDSVSYLYEDTDIDSDEAYSCTFTVDDAQAYGTYGLMSYAYGFAYTVTVQDTSGTALGTLAAGSTVNINGVGYTLNIGGSPAYPLTVTIDAAVDLTGDLTGATAEITSGMVASSVNINALAHLDVFDGGVASDVVVNVGGDLYVSDGGTAIQVKENGGYVSASDDAEVSFVSNSFSEVTLAGQNRATVHSGTTAVNTTVNSGGSLCLYSGGTATSTTVNTSGWMEASSGGMAISTTVNSGGEIGVYDGGTVFSTTVAEGGSMTVSGGTASSATVNEGGSMTVGGGSALQIVENGGWVELLAGATAVFASNSISGCSVVNKMTVHSGTTAIDTTVDSGGTAEVSSGVISGATVASDGNLLIYSGSKLTGQMVFEDGATVIPFVGSILDFDLTQTTPEAPVLVNDLSVLMGTPTYTITVGETQEIGIYNLAGGAAAFKGTMTVKREGAPADISITVGDTNINSGDMAYSLTVTDSQLLFTIMPLDTTPPVAPTASADITVPTNGNVTVTATFSDDSALKEYSLDGRTWSAYTQPVVLSDNGTVSFRGTDDAGNVSDITSYEVTNIDKVAPDAPTTSADITAPTNGFVTVTATFSGDSVTMQVSLDGTDWYNYSQPIVMTANGWVYFRGIDAAGNVSEVTGYEVTNIDITAPNAPTALADVTDPTNGDVTVTATFSGDSAVKEYSLDGQSWSAYTEPVVFSENGTVQFRGTDEAGNVSDITSYEVTNIDKVAPDAPTASADVTEPTNGNVTITAVFSDDSAVKEYSLDGQNWIAYTEPVVLSENGTVSFRGTDVAGNVSEVTSYEVTNIDKVAPEAPTVSADVTDPTNGDVTVTATFSGDSAVKEYSLDGQTWNAYTEPVALSENGTVQFRATDAAGNVSDVTSYEVTNIDKVAPDAPTFSLAGDATTGEVVVTASWDANDAECLYSLDGQTWSTYTQPLRFTQNATVQFKAVDAAGNESASADATVKTTIAPEDISLQDFGNGHVIATWPSDDLSAWAGSYDAVVTIGGLGSVGVIGLPEQGLELCNVPDGDLEVAAKPSLVTAWPEQGKTTTVTSDDAPSRLVSAESNGFDDVMFGRATGVWNANYRAGHVSLPGEKAKLKGRNQIGDLFLGSDDASILLLTDDANGDVFFLDDIYSAFPEGVDAQARLAKIDEIQAGAGADVVDLTSTRFEYVGGGLTVHGGAGDDVIWANSGDNLLFGDAGNDRIGGGAEVDLIVGGSGDDAMHGGGGEDLFVFGGNWGNDTVTQFADGKVTLWFQDGDDSKWNESTLTYTDGANSVQVSGVALENISLKFGD
ncbi:MAG: AIDA repeat-containing protein, partial [Victivallales bacterium]|nr:AIDA repeat-containing protein [Victivallales bacterium]